MQDHRADVLRLNLPRVRLTRFVIVEVGRDAARHDRGDSDTPASQIEHDRLGESCKTEFAGVVRRATGKEVRARQRADRDHHALPLDQRSKRRLHGQEHTGQVGVDHVMPVALLHCFDAREPAHAGVRDEEIQPTERVDGKRDGAPLLLSIPYVTRHADHATVAHRVELPRRLEDLILMAGRDDHVEVCLREGLRDPAANSLAASRNECRTSLCRHAETLAFDVPARRCPRRCRRSEPWYLQHVRRVVTLIRHGLTDWNVAGRFQGQSDPPLNEEGRAQARALAERTRLHGDVDLVVASPLVRARETAEIAFPHAERVLENRLMELHFGMFEGHTAAENAEKPEWSEWAEDPYRRVAPGGESYEQLRGRAVAWLDALPSDAHHVVAVTHSGTIQMLLADVLGIERPRWRKRIYIRHASVSRVLFEDGERIVERVNDTRHLPPNAWERAWP